MLHGGARPRRRPAAALMFIHDADGLHERIADRRTHEIEALFLQVPAHCIAERSRWLNVAQVEGATAQYFAVGELPEVSAESARLLVYLEIRVCIADEGF